MNKSFTELLNSFIRGYNDDAPPQEMNLILENIVKKGMELEAENERLKKDNEFMQKEFGNVKKIHWMISGLNDKLRKIRRICDNELKKKKRGNK